MTKALKLVVAKKITLRYKEPFSFQKTFYHPSHFQSELEIYKDNEYYCGLNFDENIFGLKFFYEDKALYLNIYSPKKIDTYLENKIKNEIEFRFGLNDDYSHFYDAFSDDKYLVRNIQNDYGKHLGSNYSLYEHLIISSLLQNTTIKRTVQMCSILLKKYGHEISFDNVRLYTLWNIHEFDATEEELRSLKLGYRAKIISRITTELKNEYFSDDRLRNLDTGVLVKDLLKIYGVGKQTVFYLVINQFHRTDFLRHIPLWERKILSKYLFNKQLVEEEKVISWFKKRYGLQCGYAFSIIWEDIFYQHSLKPFPWLLNIMREKNNQNEEQT